MKKVLILYGTSSYEHDVSKKSAYTIKQNMLKEESFFEHIKHDRICPSRRLIQAK